MAIESLAKIKDVRSVESIFNHIRKKVEFQIASVGRPAYEEFLAKAEIAVSYDYSDRGPIGSSIRSRVIENIEAIKKEMLEKLEEREQSEAVVEFHKNYTK